MQVTPDQAEEEYVQQDISCSTNLYMRGAR